MIKNNVVWITVSLVIAAVASFFLSSRPFVVAGIVAAGLAFWWLSRMDWWQRLYVVTLILMMGAVSNIEPLVAASQYMRYVAAALLLCATWVTSRQTPAVVKSRLQGRVLATLWVVTIIAALSIIWSVDRIQSALQAVALVILVGLIHLLSQRRWSDRSVMVADFRVAFNTLTLMFAACLVAYALKLPNAYAFGGTEDTAGRFQGIFNNPNMLALLAAISIPLGIGLLLERRSIWRFVLLLIPFSVLILTESRTSQVAVAVAVIWMVLRSGVVNAVKFAAVAGLGVILLAAFGGDLLSKTFSRFGSLEGGDLLNTRGDAWTATVDLFQMQPIGYGWQAGRDLFETLHGSVGFSFSGTSVHNSYLQFVLELGILGILPLAYLTFALCWIAVRGKARGLEGGFLGVITAGLIVQITESAMFGTGQPYPYVFWFAVAGALAMYQEVSKTESEFVPPAVQSLPEVSVGAASENPRISL